MKKIICFLALCFLLIGCSSKSTPEKTVKKYIEAFNSADVDALIECVNPAEAEETRLELLMMGSSAFSKKLDYEIKETEIDGDKAVVHLIDDDQDEKKVKLVLVDNVWYMDK